MRFRKRTQISTQRNTKMVTKKRLLFNCNKCKRYTAYIERVSFKLIKNVIESTCPICDTETNYTINFQLETEE